MKHLILASAFISLTFAANAQKLELGGNLGFNHSYTATEKTLTPAASVKAAYNVCSGFQVGVSSNFTWLSYEYSLAPLYFEDHYQSQAALPVFMSSTRFVNSIKAFANAKRSFGNLDAYAGLSGGYITTFGDQVTPNGYAGLENGYTAGGQLGLTYFVTKRWGINAEAGADYINMGGTGDYNPELSKTNLSTWNYPVTVGIRYRLFCTCPKTCPLGKAEVKP